MTLKLDCHKASEQETIEAHRNVFDVWPAGEDVDSHLKSRIASPKSARADYFVGTVNGQVATSLQSFPTTFRIRGEEVPGIQIGSVHTHADFRKRGYAEELVDFTEKYQAERGVQLSVLYSDVPPGYYAKMGYIICPSWHGWTQTAEWSEEKLKEGEFKHDYPLVELNVSDHLEEIQTLHQQVTSKRIISVVRDAAYWNYIQQKFPNDIWYGLRNASQELVTYLRLNHSKNKLTIADMVCQNDSDQLYRESLLSLVQLGQKLEVREVGGWLPELAAIREMTDLKERPKQITMFNPLSSKLVLDEPLMQAANYFSLIDHV